MMMIHSCWCNFVSRMEGGCSTGSSYSRPIEILLMLTDQSVRQVSRRYGRQHLPSRSIVDWAMSNISNDCSAHCIRIETTFCCRSFIVARLRPWSDDRMRKTSCFKYITECFPAERCPTSTEFLTCNHYLASSVCFEMRDLVVTHPNSDWIAMSIFVKRFIKRSHREDDR